MKLGIWFGTILILYFEINNGIAESSPLKIQEGTPRNDSEKKYNLEILKIPLTPFKKGEKIYS